MKCTLGIFVIIFSFSVFGSDQKVCDYMSKNRLLSLVKNTDDLKNKKYMSIVKSVSSEMDKRLSEVCAKGEPPLLSVNADLCSERCVSNGSSELRTKALLLTNGMIDLNKETRDCQRLCHHYQDVVFAFGDGLKSVTNSSQDCQEVVSSGERGNTKSDIVEAVIRSKRVSAGSKQ